MTKTRRSPKTSRGRGFKATRKTEGTEKPSTSQEPDPADLSLTACAGCNPWRVFVRTEAGPAPEPAI